MLKFIIVCILYFSTLAEINAGNEKDFFPQLPELPKSTEQFYLVQDEEAKDDILISQDILGIQISGSDELQFFQQEEVWRDETWDDPIEGDLFEGDISGVKLIAKVEMELENASNKNAILSRFKMWPNGVIPYTVSQAFNAFQRGLIYRATQEFSAKSCISWIPRDPNQHYDYVHIMKDNGCYSRVGRNGGAQVLSLGDGCFDLGTVIHEMLHATGFWHEQSRPDRDEHVKINWENIQSGMEDNFARYSWSEVSTLSLAYDVSSVMHYSSRAFSRNGRNTIESRNFGPQTMGQRSGFSYLDLQKLNTLYKCRLSETPKPIIEVTPTTTPPPPPTTTTTAPTTCRDEYNNGLCYKWYKEDQGCRRFPTFMARYCPKTCGICSLPTNNLVCQDKDQRCRAWAAYQNQCISNRQFMLRMCPQTCGHCWKKASEDEDEDYEFKMANVVGRNNAVMMEFKPTLTLILTLFVFLY